MPMIQPVEHSMAPEPDCAGVIVSGFLWEIFISIGDGSTMISDVVRSAVDIVTIIVGSINE